MPPFSNKEYADILYIYGFCNGNASKQPCYEVFIETHRLLKETQFAYVENEEESNESIELIEELFNADCKIRINCCNDP